MKLGFFHSLPPSPVGPIKTSHDKKLCLRKAGVLNPHGCRGLSCFCEPRVHPCREDEKIDIRNQADKLRKTNTRFVIGLIILFNVSVFLGLWNHNFRKERNELSRIEWLYRGLRSTINPKDTASL